MVGKKEETGPSQGRQEVICFRFVASIFYSLEQPRARKPDSATRAPRLCLWTGGAFPPDRPDRENVWHPGSFIPCGSTSAWPRDMGRGGGVLSMEGGVTIISL
jgi:hypothetical protein